MEIAVFIQNIQEERAEVALHIFSNPSDNGAMNGKALTERFEMTDRALEEMPTWPDVRIDKNFTTPYYSISLATTIKSHNFIDLLQLSRDVRE